MIPNLNWNQNTNVVPGLQDTPQHQFQSMAWNIKQALAGGVGALFDNGNAVIGAGDAGAWTVVRSCNSAAVLAGDNWTTRANVVGAAEGVAHSWIVLQSPAAPIFLPFAGQAVQLLINCLGVAGTTGNELTAVSLAQVANPFTGGSTTNAPTLPTNGISVGNKNIIRNNTGGFLLVPARQHFWRSTRGDFLFFCSRDGTGLPGCGQLWELNSPVGGEFAPPDTAPRWAIQGAFVDDFTSGALTTANYANLSTGNSIGWYVDNTLEKMMIVLQKDLSNVRATNAFTVAGGGVNARYPSEPVDCWSNQTSGNGRYGGRKQDFEIAHPTAANLTLESGSDATKRLVVGALSAFTNGPIPVL